MSVSEELTTFMFRIDIIYIRILYTFLYDLLNINV
jgi:hypothetical protein